jgi:hypothetical protein
MFVVNRDVGIAQKVSGWRAPEKRKKEIEPKKKIKKHLKW